MDSLPTLPRRSWLERMSLFFAGAITTIGMGTLVGWWLRVDELLQPFPSLPVTKANAAAAFLALGVALLLLEFGRRQWCQLAVLPAVISLVTLGEQILHRNFFIDELLAADHLLLETENPGRMSGMIAVCLVLGGLVLAWRGTGRGVQARLFAEAVAGSVIASAGFSTLLGYAAGLPPVYRWGTATATSPVSAIALMLFGSAMLLLAWRDSIKAEGGPPVWSPMPAVIGCLTLTVILWVGLRERERAFAGERTQTAMNSFAASLKLTLDEQTHQLESLARSWGDNMEGEANWPASAAEQFSQRSGPFGCVSISYVDAAHRTVWTYPAAGNEGTLNFDHFTVEERRNAILQAESNGGAVLSSTTRIQTPTGIERGTAITSNFPSSAPRNPERRQWHWQHITPVTTRQTTVRRRVATRGRSSRSCLG